MSQDTEDPIDRAFDLVNPVEYHFDIDRFIPEYAPLGFLIAANFNFEYLGIYHDEAHRNGPANPPLHMLHNSKEILDFIDADTTRKTILAAALKALKDKTIHKKDLKEKKIRKYELVSAGAEESEILVETLSFYFWLKENFKGSVSRNFQLSASRYDRNSIVCNYTYQRATDEELKEIRSMPLLTVGEAILYSLGRKNGGQGPFYFVEKNQVAQKIIDYIRRDYFRHELALYGYEPHSENELFSLCSAKVEPDSFIKCALLWEGIELLTHEGKENESEEKEDESKEESDIPGERERKSYLRVIAAILNSFCALKEESYSFGVALHKKAMEISLTIRPETIGKIIQDAQDLLEMEGVQIEKIVYKKNLQYCKEVAESSNVTDISSEQDHASYLRVIAAILHYFSSLKVRHTKFGDSVSNDAAGIGLMIGSETIGKKIKSSRKILEEDGVKIQDISYP